MSVIMSVVSPKLTEIGFARWQLRNSRNNGNLFIHNGSAETAWGIRAGAFVCGPGSQTIDLAQCARDAWVCRQSAVRQRCRLTHSLRMERWFGHTSARADDPTVAWSMVGGSLPRLQGRERSNRKTSSSSQDIARTVGFAGMRHTTR